MTRTDITLLYMLSQWKFVGRAALFQKRQEHMMAIDHYVLLNGAEIEVTWQSMLNLQQTHSAVYPEISLGKVREN